jgi:hypothetical protein
MIAKKAISLFLKRAPGNAYCDDCLSTILNIRPRQQVQKYTAELAQQPFFDGRPVTVSPAALGEPNSSSNV